MVIQDPSMMRSLWITVLVTLGFTALGMLLSIPAAAIMSFIYQDYFLPRQETRRAQK